MLDRARQQQRFQQLVKQQQEQQIAEQGVLPAFGQNQHATGAANTANNQSEQYQSPT